MTMGLEISNAEGVITGINGTLLEVKGLEDNVRLHDLVKISKQNLLGEIIQIYKTYTIIQSFESTLNLKLGQKVTCLNEPLSMELGPGLLGSTFDGIQRPLEITFKVNKEGKLERGIYFEPLSREKKWHFIPCKKIGNIVEEGDVVGSVQETALIEHRIMLPPGYNGVLSFIVDEGDYTIIDEIYKIKNENTEKSFSMMQKWKITKTRPSAELKRPNIPLITGIRIIDLLFPIAKGGTIAIPGGFGTGKTVIQQCLAKYCDADIIIYIGCGEPGNEIANVLKQFTETIDPNSGRPIMDRIVLVVNTSNMPGSSREASLFSGVTIAEYYRDMGYDVVVLTDSISRWAESLRELSGLLEEMPAEEGYPGYLPSKLSSFFERAGLIKALGKDKRDNEKFGSISIIGTISPPGGDFSEPVTSAAKRVVQGVWALDQRLAYLKHFPAINWLQSYSNYPEYIKKWWKKIDIDWPEIKLDWVGCRNQLNEILSQESNIQNITQLLGEGGIPPEQRLEIIMNKIITNGFLIQNAFDEIDVFTSPEKLLSLIKLFLLFYKEGKNRINKGLVINAWKSEQVISEMIKLRYSIPNENYSEIDSIKTRMINQYLDLMFI
ncbi:MAG: V-type ATP synthase subunit A [Promethearchaeota archaeon]